MLSITKMCLRATWWFIEYLLQSWLYHGKFRCGAMLSVASIGVVVLSLSKGVRVYRDILKTSEGGLNEFVCTNHTLGRVT